MITVRSSQPPRRPHHLWKAWASVIAGARRRNASAENLLRIGQAGFFDHQRQAFDRILTGGSVFLTAGTSSGKTLSVALPLLEQLAAHQKRRVCFVYPTRALLEGQRLEVGELAGLRGLTSGVSMGGKRVGQLLDAMASRVVFATPDEIYWYFAKTVKHAGALAWSLTQVDDFVFDEVHVFRSYALENLIWFLKRLQALSPGARFHFLSATTAPQLLERLKPFGDFDEPIQGESFTGPIEVEFSPSGPITWRYREQVLDYLRAGEEKHTVAIFNSARFVHRFSLQYGSREDGRFLLAGTRKRLFRYTGYMDKGSRDGVIAEFQASGGILLTTSAAEVGVDFDCEHLLMEDFGAESSVQRFGRAGRGGRAARVTIVAEPGLEGRVRQHLPGDEPTRGEFVAALSQALGGFEHLANTSQFAAYSQYCVNRGLGPTGDALNQSLFTAEERDRLDSWLAQGGLIRYGLRSVMPQVRLSNGVGADPFYILQLAPKGSLRPVEDSRFELVRVDRTYDSLVWEPFEFGVRVDTIETFRSSQLVDAEQGQLALRREPPLDRFHVLCPRGASRLFRRPEGPILKVGNVRVGLCFGDVFFKRFSPAAGVVMERKLAVHGWYYLLLHSEETSDLGSLVWRMVYPDGGDQQDPVPDEGQHGTQNLVFNRGASADLARVRGDTMNYVFVLEKAYGACYEIWRELCGQGDH